MPNMRLKVTTSALGYFNYYPTRLQWVVRNKIAQSLLNKDVSQMYSFMGYARLPRGNSTLFRHRYLHTLEVILNNAAFISRVWESPFYVLRSRHHICVYTYSIRALV